MNDVIDIDLREFFRVLVTKLWIVALCAAIVGTAVLVYTVNFVSPQYNSSVSIYVNNNSGASDGTYISSSDLAVALRLVETYVNIIQSDTVLEKVIDESGLNLTAGQLRGMISAEPIGETEMFKVTVRSPYPQASADLANAIATVAPTAIAEIIDGSTAKIIDYAKVPKSPSSPNYVTNTILGVVGGAAVAILIILLQTVFDVRIKNEEDIAKISTIPVLGVIPQLSTDNKKQSTGKKARR